MLPAKDFVLARVFDADGGGVAAYVRGCRKMRKERESGFAGWFRGTVHGVSGFPPYQAVLAIEWL
jgi:hypothetical protein